MNKPVTYRADRVKAIFGGSHIVSGLDADSFITIEANGGDTTMESGADGEVVRSVDASKMYKVTVVLQYGSPSDKWLMDMRKRDMSSSDGMFDMLIKDLGADPLFTGQYCCLQNNPQRVYGKTGAAHSFVILVGQGDFEPQ